MTFCDLFCDPSQLLRRNPFMLSPVSDISLPKRLPVSGQSHAQSLRVVNTSESRLVGQNHSQEDPNWVQQMLAVRNHRDRAAFARLFEHFAPRIKGFLINSGADASMAEECAQDVMTTLWRKADQFDPSRASVAAWVFTIARNRRIDLLRKERRPEPEDLSWGPEPEPEQADVLALQQETDHLTQALATLPEAQRDLIEKAYFGDLTQSEIAKITGLPLGTIKSRIRLALDRLRHAMK